MIPFGIPVRKCFRNLMDQEEAKEKLGFSPEKKLHLLIGGSMGAGNLEKLTREVRKKNGEDSVLAVICGNNEKVREQLEKRFEGDSSVSIIGYTDQMPFIWRRQILFIRNREDLLPRKRQWQENR